MYDDVKFRDNTREVLLLQAAAKVIWKGLYTAPKNFLPLAHNIVR